VTDEAQGTISPTRVLDNFPLSAGTVHPGVGGCAERPMPMAAAIPWIPVGNGTASPESAQFPVFITQGTLRAVHEHCAASDGRLGFLTGQLYRCSATGVPYVVIASTFRVPWPIAGDDQKPIAELTREVAQSELAQNGDRLLGWYRSSPSPEAGLSPRDAELHSSLLSHPWDVALLVRSDSGAAGALFRKSSSATWRQEPLGFYELLDEGRPGPAGEKRTVLAWWTYRAGDAVAPIAAVPKGRVTRPDPAPLPRLLVPDEFDDEDDVGKRPRSSTLDVLRRRAPRLVAYGVVGLLALWGLVQLATLAAAPAGSQPAAVAAGGVSSARVDQLADTVALALVAFDLRVRMFERRQMACADLSRGLVELEERWMVYNIARKGALGTFDAASNTRDAGLYTTVDAAERRFERSPCPRP